MQVLLFASRQDETYRTVRKEFPEDTVELHTTVGSIALRLLKSDGDRTISIFLPADEQELIDIYCIQNVFNKFPIVLVLPSKDKFVEAMGYRLRPRFMCHRENDLAGALSSLKSMAMGSTHFITKLDNKISAKKGGSHHGR